MRNYELTLIFVPDLPSDSEGLTEGIIDAIIKKLELKVKSKDFWGKRILAYPILPAGKAGKKHKEGIYVMMKVELKPEEVNELESKLKLEEKVLRYLIIKS